MPISSGKQKGKPVEKSLPVRRPPNDVSRRSENEKKKEPPTSATDLLKDASRRSGKEKQKEPPILAPDPPEDASRRSKSEEQDEPPTPAPDLPEDAPHLSDPEEDLLPKEEAALFKQQKYYFEYLLNERVNLPLKIFDHEIQRADWVQRLTSHLYKTEYRECFNVLVFRVDLLLDTKITGIEREILVPWYDCKDEEFMFWVRNPRQEEDMLLLEKNAGTDDDIMPIVGKKKGHGEPKLGLISYMTLVFKDGKVTSKEASSLSYPSDWCWLGKVETTKSSPDTLELRFKETPQSGPAERDKRLGRT